MGQLVNRPIQGLVSNLRITFWSTYSPSQYMWCHPLKYHSMQGYSCRLTSETYCDSDSRYHYWYMGGTGEQVVYQRSESREPKISQSIMHVSELDYQLM